MLDHLSHAIHTLPLFATVGLMERSIQPLAVEDLAEVPTAALVDRRLSQQTVAITGPEELRLSEAAGRVALVLGRTLIVIPAPVWLHYILAQGFEWTMKIPLLAKAQARILAEGVVEAAPSCDLLPPDLMPSRRFDDDQIRQGLPEAGPFTLRDLRWCA
jgi:uncharacterized protein YbjT (DUF2867 family)